MGGPGGVPWPGGSSSALGGHFSGRPVFSARIFGAGPDIWAGGAGGPLAGRWRAAGGAYAAFPIVGGRVSVRWARSKGGPTDADGQQARHP